MKEFYMSNGLIILIIVIAVALILAYVAAVVLRKRNETLLDNLEERKEKLYNLPVNDEVEAIKNMHLIGQSQVTFREWNQKWVDLSLNSFADIENNIFEAEGYNNSFRFIKAKHAIDNIESQINLVEEDIAAIRDALAELEKQEAKNSGRVLHALELFENLQVKVAEDTEQYGQAVHEIQKQLQNIESEFSQFVTLNSSGDPVEAADILDKTENHILALTHIVEKVPGIVTELTKTLPDQLEDLESGYRKLVEAGYHFVETDIESRFYQLHATINQKEINTLYDIFTREITAQRVVEKLIESLPAYLAHTKENNQQLQSELDRLSKMYLLSDNEDEKVRDLQSELSSLESVVLSTVEDSAESKQAYSLTQESLETIQARLKEIEDEQIILGERLEKIEKDDDNARQKVNIYINKLHTIKRYMEKRNLPGIPKTFMTTFFVASDHTEALLAELEQLRVNIDNVNRLLEDVTGNIHDLENETYHIVQYATLTEQLLQYSNRYRSFDQSIQEAFNKALYIFEHQFDYETSFEVISQALEVVEPGVTNRFVTSYEKTRENIRF